MAFQLKIKRSARNKNSRIILSLDLSYGKTENLVSDSIKILEDSHNYICGLKINRHIVLPVGLFNGIEKLVKTAHSLDLPTIMDCKINDVGNTNKIIAEYYFNAGFDAVTVNPFVGWRGGLEPVFEIARRKNRGIILLVYMSHEGSLEGYGQTVYDPFRKSEKPQYVLFAEKALSWGADGVIVGATYPDKIREVLQILGRKINIYSPGIGVQGGKIEQSVKMGTDYLIVGRSIFLDAEPAVAAKRIRDTANKFFRKRL